MEDPLFTNVPLTNVPWTKLRHNRISPTSGWEGAPERNHAGSNIVACENTTPSSNWGGRGWGWLLSTPYLRFWEDVPMSKLILFPVEISIERIIRVARFSR